MANCPNFEKKNHCNLVKEFGCYVTTVVMFMIPRGCGTRCGWVNVRYHHGRYGSVGAFSNYFAWNQQYVYPIMALPVSIIFNALGDDYRQISNIRYTLLRNNDHSDVVGASPALVRLLLEILRYIVIKNQKYRNMKMSIGEGCLYGTIFNAHSILHINFVCDRVRQHTRIHKLPI